MSKPPFTIKPMLAIGILSLAASFTAQAAPATYGNYTLDAEYILGGSGTTQDGMTDPNASVNTYYSNGADLYLSTSRAFSSIIITLYGYLIVPPEESHASVFPGFERQGAERP